MRRIMQFVLENASFQGQIVKKHISPLNNNDYNKNMIKYLDYGGRKGLIAIVLLLCAAAAAGFWLIRDSRPGKVIMSDDSPLREAGIKRLTFFGFKAGEDTLTAIENVLRGFMALHPEIVISYEGMRGEPYWQTLNQRVETRSLDDMAMLHHDYILNLERKGNLEDMRHFAGLDNYQAAMARQFTNEDGSIYFLPTSISTYNLFVNEDLLKKHDLKPPKNLAEFSEICEYFASMGVTPIIANNFASPRFLMVAKGLFPVYQNENPQAIIEKFNSGEADLAETLRPGLELLAMMRDMGWINAKEVLETSHGSEDLRMFAKGERPFLISGGWTSPRLAAMEPAFEFSAHPFPILEDGAVLILNADTCVSINSDTDYPEEARIFMEYLIKPDVLWKYCDAQSSFTPLKNGAPPSDKALAPVVEYLHNGRNVIGSDHMLNLPLDSALRECGNAILQGASVEEAMSMLADRLRPAAKQDMQAEQ